MDEKRKRMGALGWTVVALCLLLAYPLSVGPTWWLRQKGLWPEVFEGPLEVIYSPLHEPIYEMPGPIFKAYRRYIGLWATSP